MSLYLLLDILLELIKRMAVKKKSEKRLKKEDYWGRLQMVVGKYKNVLFINSDNVSSKQILKLRSRLREIDAYMIMGKNVSSSLFIFWRLLSLYYFSC